jgi:hypothetical protein
MAMRVTAIYVDLPTCTKAWIAGTSPAMTQRAVKLVGKCLRSTGNQDAGRRQICKVVGAGAGLSRERAPGYAEDQMLVQVRTLGSSS